MQFLFKSLKLTIAAIVISVAITACQPKAKPVPPDAKQHAALERLHKGCIAASPGQKGEMLNLASLRKKKQTFTCDEMKELCANDYPGQMYLSNMLKASVENAFHKVCRKSQKTSRSAACNKLTVCNAKGFESLECGKAIAPYNR